MFEKIMLVCLMSILANLVLVHNMFDGYSFKAKIKVYEFDY